MKNGVVNWLVYSASAWTGFGPMVLDCLREPEEKMDPKLVKVQWQVEWQRYLH
jgi:hypothetical protein